MQTRELTKKEWKEVLSRFAVKPGEKTVREFANEEGVGFNALTYRLYSCPEGAAARGKGEEVRLVAVDVSRRSGEEQEHWSRWLELETLRGTKLRFVEGTGGEYLGGPDESYCRKGDLMISLPSSVKICLATEPVDMRRSIDGLSPVQRCVSLQCRSQRRNAQGGPERHERDTRSRRLYRV